MSVVAKLRYLRISPRKVRLVTNAIKGKNVAEARSILDFTVRKASQPVKKLLESAIANAKNNFSLDEKNLYIAKVFVDQGRRLKRWRARARGRAAEIHKDSSHITLILEEHKAEKKEKGKKEKIIKKGKDKEDKKNKKDTKSKSVKKSKKDNKDKKAK